MSFINDMRNNTISREQNPTLNEFVYKLNRRYFGDKLFDRAIISSIQAIGLITDIQLTKLVIRLRFL